MRGNVVIFSRLTLLEQGCVVLITGLLSGATVLSRNIDNLALGQSQLMREPARFIISADLESTSFINTECKKQPMYWGLSINAWIWKKKHEFFLHILTWITWIPVFYQRASIFQDGRRKLWYFIKLPVFLYYPMSLASPYIKKDNSDNDFYLTEYVVVRPWHWA